MNENANAYVVGLQAENKELRKRISILAGGACRGLIEDVKSGFNYHRACDEIEMLKQKLNEETGKCIEARRFAERWRKNAYKNLNWNTDEVRQGDALPWEVEK